MYCRCGLGPVSDLNGSGLGRQEAGGYHEAVPGGLRPPRRTSQRGPAIQPAGWLAVQLAGWLADWLGSWLAGMLAAWLAGWLYCWLTALLAGWLADWLAD